MLASLWIRSQKVLHKKTAHRIDAVIYPLLAVEQGMATLNEEFEANDHQEKVTNAIDQYLANFVQ